MAVLNIVVMLGSEAPVSHCVTHDVHLGVIKKNFLRASGLHGISKLLGHHPQVDQQADIVKQAHQVSPVRIQKADSAAK